MRQVEVSEAAGQFDALLAEVRQGEEIVLTDAGQAIARLVAAAPLLRSRSFEMLDAEVRTIHDEMRAQGRQPFTTDEIISSIREGRRY